MRSEPRPSPPQSSTAPGRPPAPIGKSRDGSAGSSLTSSQATQTFFARGLRGTQPARSFPLNKGVHRSSALDTEAVEASSSATSNDRGYVGRMTRGLRGRYVVRSLAKLTKSERRGDRLKARVT